MERTNDPTMFVRCRDVVHCDPLKCWIIARPDGVSDTDAAPPTQKLDADNPVIACIELKYACLLGIAVWSVQFPTSPQTRCPVPGSGSGPLLFGSVYPVTQ